MFIFYLTKFKWVFILLGGVAAWFTISSYYETKGYNRAVTEIQRESADKIAAATTEAIHAAEIEIALALARQRLLFDGELKRAENERVVSIEIKEVISEVEKIVYKDGDCRNIGDDSFRLLNESINHANKATRN